jgi:hypothetical protein
VPPDPPETAPEETAPKAASGAASSTSSPFVGDTGPGFDPDAAPPPLADDGDQGPPGSIEIPEIPEEQVRSALHNGGDLAHAAVGVGQLDWVMTNTDQDRIAPPLTRIINKHEQLARIAGRSDELSVAIGAGLYTWRSLLEREGVLKAARAPPNAPQPDAEQEPPASPPAGLAVPEGYVPEAYRRFGKRPGVEAT